MKLYARDLNNLIDENEPRPTNVRSAEDYLQSNAAQRDELVAQLIQQRNPSSARVGETLPGRVIQKVEATADLEVLSGQEVESEDGAISVTPMPTALSGCVLGNIHTRADLLRELTQRLPINDFGLPRIIYRADLLDPQVFQDHQYPEGSKELSDQYFDMQNFLDVSTIHLDYSQGFPALPDGTPLWARLPNEPAEHFAAFTDYCTQPGTRQLHKLTISPLQPLSALLEWFHEDYWSIRAKCYDLSHAVYQAKLREQRILGCEDKHFLLAEKLVQRLENLHDTIDWDVLQSEPEKYVKILATAIGLQRQALSLPSSTSTTGQREGGAAVARTESIEMIMRRATAPELKMIRDHRAEDPTNNVSVKALLKNPAALASAQELIIRMTNTTQINGPPLPEDLAANE